MRSLCFLTLAILALAAPCCSNPFLGSYVGERFPPVGSAAVITQPPSPQTARWIGRADFSTDAVIEPSQAIAAARAVGADLVEWSDRDTGTMLQWSSNTVSVSNWTGQISTAPMPVADTLFRCSARFYRSNSLGGSPLNPGQEPMPMLVPAAGGS